VLPVKKLLPIRKGPKKSGKRFQCFAEQKNYDAVRKTVGYFRFDTAEECAALAEVYRFLCPLYNCWMPSFRLIATEKQGDGTVPEGLLKNAEDAL
jgi:hypothetical protein